jgi:feruloyl esterase
MIFLLLSFLFALPASRLLALAESFEESCRSFKPKVQNATVELVEFVSRNTSVELKYRDASCGGPGKSPPAAQDLCRVALYVHTTNRSGIQFEAWLPKDWNGRFLATGNGGIGGCEFEL